LALIAFLAHFIVFGFLIVFLHLGPGLEYFKENKWILFVLGAIYGIGDAGWTNFCSISIGYYFIDQSEAGFSNFSLFTSLGSVIIFVWGPQFFPKLYFMIGVLVLSSILLIILDRFVSPLDGKKFESIKE